MTFKLELWSDKNAYNETPMKLAGLFKNNFETFTNYQIGEETKLTEVDTSSSQSQFLTAGKTVKYHLILSQGFWDGQWIVNYTNLVN
ncbi:hypothetical protein ACFX2C_019938 [Malus domestica]